jgi:3D (Asp-Asp-Asp) domain-containing protein
MLLAFQYHGVDAQETGGIEGGTASSTLVLNNSSKVVPFCKKEISQASILGANQDCVEAGSDDLIAKPKTKKISAVLTAYSSTVEETDSTPFLTANGTYVHDGVIANNTLPFGTRVRIPALYGSKIFSVEDRMHWRFGNSHFDIWFPSNSQAKQFGVRHAYIEVLD